MRYLTRACSSCAQPVFRSAIAPLGRGRLQVRGDFRLVLPRVREERFDIRMQRERRALDTHHDRERVRGQRFQPLHELRPHRDAFGNQAITRDARSRIGGGASIEIADMFSPESERFVASPRIGRS